MTRNKILIINNGLAGGGIERASVSLANYFARSGYEIVLIALYKSDHFYSLHSSISLIEPEFSRDQSNKYYYLLRMMYFARKYIKLTKPDTILSFSEWTNPYVILANLGLNYPLFITDRMNPQAKLPWPSELLKRLVYKKASGIIAQSHFAKEILFKKTKSKKITVINNPVKPIEKIRCLCKNRIVTVGRLSLEKGHYTLLVAFSKLKHKDWELSIVGEGSERVVLERLCNELEISDRVIFHGHLNDFRFQLSEAQIFVLPSLTEGFPNALLEAMSVPIACISTNYSKGIHEIIRHGVNGLLVQPGNPNAMAEALSLLINDAILREQLAEKAYAVRLDYQFEKITSQYLDVIFSRHT
jgi:glycosyltransferase involved in cell wall biosynthesis